MAVDEADRLADRLNLAPLVVGMALAWGTPMLAFWGAAWGPMKPHHYPPADTAPAWPAVLVGLGFCFLPCLLGRWYFGSGAGPVERRVYERLGVLLFRRFAPSGDAVNRLVRKRHPDYRVIRGAARDAYLRAGVSGERAHLVLLLMGLLTAAHAVRIGWYGWAVALTLGNALANLYPCLMQRYNRGRLTAIARRRGQTQPLKTPMGTETRS